MSDPSSMPASVSPVVFALPGNEDAAASLAALLGGEVGRLTNTAFPDCESYLRVDTKPSGRPAVIVATLHHPNAKALPLLFLADALRDAGATAVGLVAPYLAYLRQDARFRPGEAMTSRTFARVISGAVDWLVTADPHLHRYSSLSELYAIPTSVVHLAPHVGRWIAAHVDAPFVIGPDSESQQWVEGVASAAGAPCTVLSKTRRGDRDVVVSIPDLSMHEDRTPVLVDDIISTGHTMIAALRHLRDARARPAYCAAVHAVFALGAYVALWKENPVNIVTTNTITHPSNDIDALPSIADAVRELLADARPAGHVSDNA